MPSTNESSTETEMLELIAKMDPVIAKPDKLLKDSQITDLYKQFREEIQKIQDEENQQRRLKDDTQRRASQPEKGTEQSATVGVVSGGTRKGRDAKRTSKKLGDLDDSDYEEVMREQLDTISDHSPSKQGYPMNLPVKIIKMEAKKPLAMPKKGSVPPTLSTQLTESENAMYQRAIKDFKIELQKKIDERYPDDYNKTTLMDDNITKMKNEILRKIKFYK